MTRYLKNNAWIVLAYMIFVPVILGIAWPSLDKSGIIAIASVLVGSLAGVLGTYITFISTLHIAERESILKIKSEAASQALELTKLEIELRLKEGNQSQILAAAKIYREFYKALFELYDTKTWPKDIENQGLLNIYKFKS
jgi:hypothetical protein